MILLSVAIPTYRRGEIALQTIEHLLPQLGSSSELLVVDQSEQHSDDVVQRMAALEKRGSLRWIRLQKPSIPCAMNVALLESRGKAVLFVDDDIVPAPGLLGAHLAAQESALLVAGQVLQPGESAVAMATGEKFRFNSTAPAWIQEFMGGNFSVRRDVALGLGGFDENFVGAAYRFEAEFAHRFRARHGLIRFEPGAVIDHLAVSSGGTRAYGHHLRTAAPAHSVGEYYFLLRTRPPRWIIRMVSRLLRAIRTRHHLRRPWWIPATLLAEVRGLLWASRLARQGPSYIRAPGALPGSTGN